MLLDRTSLRADSLRRLRAALFFHQPMLHYLASPYTHPDAAIMEHRRVAACRKAAELIESGLAVLSPIAHNVALIREAGTPTGWDCWRSQDLAMLTACDKLLVLQLPSWQDSIGVRAEIAAAKQLGKPVEFLPWCMPPAPPRTDM